MFEFRKVWKHTERQELIEVILFIAFVALASVALILGARDGIKGIW